MIALIQLKGLAKEGFSKCPQRTFLKACRPVNNQAWGNPALTTQEMQAVSTAWHCAVTTYHSWAFSQPSAVWKHHSPYLSPPYHGTMLAVEHTHLSQLYRLPFSFFLFLLFFNTIFAGYIWLPFCSVWAVQTEYRAIIIGGYITMNTIDLRSLYYH